MTDQAVSWIEILNGISMMCFVAVSWVLVVRLLGVYRRTNQRPELCLAIQYICVALGYPLAAIGSTQGERFGLVIGGSIMIVAMALVRAGVAAAFFFTWQSFRPQDTWGRMLAYTGAFVLTVTFVDPIRSVLAATRFAEIAASAGGGGLVVTVAASAIVFSWGAIESIAHYRLASRRMTIGLADPVTVNRMLLWGVVMTLSSVVAVANLATIVSGRNLLTYGPVVALSAIAGMVCTTLLFLAFVPPRSYLSWIRDRAESVA